MTKLIERTGNLFDSDAPALLHGVNIEGVFGSGIAPQFAAQFPGLEVAYRDACMSGLLHPGEVFAWQGGGQIVYNCASQDAQGRSARLEWLEESVERAACDADDRHIQKIALPRIGSGVGGLDWDDVRRILVSIAGRHRTVLEVWALAGRETRCDEIFEDTSYQRPLSIRTPATVR